MMTFAEHCAGCQWHQTFSEHQTYQKVASGYFWIIQRGTKRRFNNKWFFKFLNFRQQMAVGVMLWMTDCSSHLHPVHALLLRGLQTRWHVLDVGEDGLAAATPRVSAASLAASVPSVPLPASWVLTVSLLLEKRITLYTGGSWEISSCYEIEWVLNSFWKGFKNE